MHNGRLNENNLSTRVRLHENLKSVLSCHSDQNFIHLFRNRTCSFTISSWLNAVKVTLLSLKIEFDGQMVTWGLCFTKVVQWKSPATTYGKKIQNQKIQVLISASYFIQKKVSIHKMQITLNVDYCFDKVLTNSN